MSATGKHAQDEGNELTRDDFGNGYTLFGFDLTPDACDGSCFHLVRNSNLRIEIHFAAALAQPVNVVVYGEFEAVLEIDKGCNVIYDYETDQIERLLAHYPLMCHYTVTAKDELPEIVETYPFALVCNTHNADQPGEHSVAMYVDERGDYFDLYGRKPKHIESTNFMNEHCSEWASNERTLQSPISTVCGQYCVAFLTLRCGNVSMHTVSRLFTTDLVANDCRVFDWLYVRDRK